MKIHDIVPYERNARHNASAVPVVADSIREFGLRGTIGLESRERRLLYGGTRASRRADPWGGTRFPTPRSSTATT